MQHMQKVQQSFQYSLARLPNRHRADTNIIVFSAMFVKKLLFAKQSVYRCLASG